MQAGEQTTGTQQAGTRTGPTTGDVYTESLRDGRRIPPRGERVEDVTIHQFFGKGRMP